MIVTPAVSDSFALRGLSVAALSPTACGVATLYRRYPSRAATTFDTMPYNAKLHPLATSGNRNLPPALDRPDARHATYEIIRASLADQAIFCASGGRQLDVGRGRESSARLSSSCFRLIASSPRTTAFRATWCSSAADRFLVRLHVAFGLKRDRTATSSPLCTSAGRGGCRCVQGA